MSNPTPAELEAERSEVMRLANKCIYVIGRLRATFGLNPDVIDPHHVEELVLKQASDLQTLRLAQPALIDDRARLEWLLRRSDMTREEVDAMRIPVATIETPAPAALDNPPAQ